MNRAAYDAWYNVHKNERLIPGQDGSAWDLWQAATAAERERCAKLCERYALQHHDIRRAALEVCAENLRMEPA